jgi:hypothetical protein
LLHDFFLLDSEEKKWPGEMESLPKEKLMPQKLKHRIELAYLLGR